MDRAPARRRSRFDGFIDGIAIQRLPIAFRTEGFDVECGGGEGSRQSNEQQCHGDIHREHLISESACYRAAYFENERLFEKKGTIFFSTRSATPLVCVPG